jgi:hypothetical protein
MSKSKRSDSSRGQGSVSVEMNPINHPFRPKGKTASPPRQSKGKERAADVKFSGSPGAASIVSLLEDKKDSLKSSIEVIDRYLALSAQHNKNKRASENLILVATSSIATLATAAVNAQRYCSAGAEDVSRRDCGLASASIAASVLGLLGLVLTVRNLLDDKTDISAKTKKLDDVMAFRLQKVGGPASAVPAIDPATAKVITTFSQLSEAEQMEIRDYFSQIDPSLLPL